MKLVSIKCRYKNGDEKTTAARFNDLNTAFDHYEKYLGSRQIKSVLFEVLD